MDHHHQKDERSSDRKMDRPVREVMKGHGSQVVFFSNLPREEEKKKELLTIAGRFGNVEKHLFLTDQVTHSPLHYPLTITSSSDHYIIIILCVCACAGVCPAGDSGGRRDAGEVLQREPAHHQRTTDPPQPLHQVQDTQVSL